MYMHVPTTRAFILTRHVLERSYSSVPYSSVVPLHDDSLYDIVAVDAQKSI
jgi:hypothetical protein